MAGLLRISIIGTMPGGEVWSVNPVYSWPVPLALSTDEVSAIAISVDAVPVPAALLAVNVPEVKVTGCRVEARELTGELEAVSEHARTTPAAGSGGTPHPFQTSLVTSLRTADSTARGKGRLYWPATSVGLTTATLRIPISETGSFVSGMNSYLAAIRAAIRPVAGLNSAVLSVWSRSNNTCRPVLSMRVGDVADVQRRRRDAVAEAYTSATVAAL